MGRVLCEGGPHLLGDLAAADLLNELCLSLSPTLAGPGATRVIAGQPLAAHRMKLAHVLAGEDDFLFLRYFAHAQDQ
jgi:riboflavin biosynthesis pyrimidine reductase